MSETQAKEPDDIVNETRMSFGDHLEELRRRVIRSLLGLVVTTVLCFKFGDTIIGLLTAPYSVSMENLGFDPRMVQLNPAESFMEYFKVSLKFGILFAAPWMLYQIWQFVAAGLYPAERRLVRLFAPTSIILFVTGASFMVVVVLSGLMEFLIGISMWFPMPDDNNPLYHFLKGPPAIVTTSTQPAAPPPRVPLLAADPEHPADGQVWFNVDNSRLNIRYGDDIYSTRLQKADSRRFVQPFFSISEYLGFVVNLGLAFGLGFQIPIVVVFLIALRIITAAQMAAARKYVILGVAVLAAVLTPSPDVGTMMLLAVPMVLLFELGLLAGRMVERKRKAA